MARGVDVSLTFEEALLLDRVIGLERHGYPLLFSLVKKADWLWTAQGVDPDMRFWISLASEDVDPKEEIRA